MSIFVAELAFSYSEDVVNLTKLSVLTALITSVILAERVLSLKHTMIGTKIKRFIGSVNL